MKTSDNLLRTFNSSEAQPLLHTFPEHYASISNENIQDKKLFLSQVNPSLYPTRAKHSGFGNCNIVFESQRSHSWPQIHKADFIEYQPNKNDSMAEHVLVPAGHMSLVEGWHVGLCKACVVLGLQAIINALPLWLALRGELGEEGPPDWSNTQNVVRALAWSALADWGANVTDTIYLQGLRSQLHSLPNWAQEFVASLGTCLLDTVLTTPLFFFRQKAIVNPTLSLTQTLTTSPVKDVYAGAGALLANNLGFMNVFYPLNELSIRATHSEHHIWRQVLIGIIASVAASTVAWPAEWLRAQQSLPEHASQSAFEIFQSVNFSLPVIFKGFPELLFAAIIGGIFTGMANKYMRTFQDTSSVDLQVLNDQRTSKSTSYDLPMESQIPLNDSCKKPITLSQKSSCTQELPISTKQSYDNVLNFV